MCFNSKVSLVALGIGILSIIYLIYQKLYEVALLLATIVPMQLVEYFAHTALKNGDKDLNYKAGMAGLLLIILQPLIITTYWLFYTIKSETTKTVMFISQFGKNTIAMKNMFVLKIMVKLFNKLISI